MDQLIFLQFPDNFLSKLQITRGLLYSKNRISIWVFIICIYIYIKSEIAHFVIHLEALVEIKEKFFKETENFQFELRPSLFAVTDGTIRSVGHLLAACICHNGPTPNFFADWVYEYIVSGTCGVVNNLPLQLDVNSTFGPIYNKVT